MTVFDESEVRKLKEMMDNFVHLKSNQHPEYRIERMENKLDTLSEAVQEIKIGLSNAQLVQKGVLWLAGTISGSAVIMTMTFLFKG